MFLSPNALLPALQINFRRDIEESSAGQVLPVAVGSFEAWGRGCRKGTGRWPTIAQREGELQICPQLIAPRFSHI